MGRPLVPLADLLRQPQSMLDAPAACGSCARLADPAAVRVTLMGGDVVCSWCPRWLHETGMRARVAHRILALPGKPARRAALADYGARFGAEARLRLEREVLAEYGRRTAAPPLPTEPSDA